MHVRPSQASCGHSCDSVPALFWYGKVIFWVLHRVGIQKLVPLYGPAIRKSRPIVQVLELRRLRIPQTKFHRIHCWSGWQCLNIKYNFEVLYKAYIAPSLKKVHKNPLDTPQSSSSFLKFRFHSCKTIKYGQKNQFAFVVTCKRGWRSFEGLEQVEQYLISPQVQRSLPIFLLFRTFSLHNHPTRRKYLKI